MITMINKYILGGQSSHISTLSEHECTITCISNLITGQSYWVGAPVYKGVLGTYCEMRLVGVRFLPISLGVDSKLI